MLSELAFCLQDDIEGAVPFSDGGGDLVEFVDRHVAELIHEKEDGEVIRLRCDVGEDLEAGKVEEVEEQGVVAHLSLRTDEVDGGLLFPEVFQIQIIRAGQFDDVGVGEEIDGGSCGGQDIGFDLLFLGDEGLIFRENEGFFSEDVGHESVHLIGIEQVVQYPSGIGEVVVFRQVVSLRPEHQEQQFDGGDVPEVGLCPEALMDDVQGDLFELLVCFEAGQGIEPHTLFQVEGVEYLDLVALVVEMSGGLLKNFAGWIGDDHRTNTLQDIGDDESVGFSLSGRRQGDGVFEGAFQGESFFVG